MSKLNIKSRFILTLLLIMVTTAIPVFATQTIYDLQSNNVEENKYLKKDGDAAFDVLNSILIQDVESKAYKFNDFKKDYAGSKIDEQGKLVVYISKNKSVIKALKDELDNKNVKEDVIKFVEVKFSYNDLKVQQKVMWDLRNNLLKDDIILKEWASKIVSMPVDPNYNCVSILVNNFTPSDYEITNELFGEFAYRVELVEGTGEINEEITTLKPGQSIGTGGSLGFRCTLDGVDGFITAVHTGNYTSINPITVNGTSVGTITAGKYDGMADFAFVKITNSNYLVARSTNTTPSRTLHASHYVIALPQGYTVYMAGGTSTSIRQGVVKYYDYSISSGTEWLVCDYPSSPGDSGGVIFAEVNGDYCVVGIHDGTISISGTNLKYGTKLTTMMNYYNILIY